MQNEKLDEVLIIGAGIAGMDCALDLANAGYKVHLIEKTPCIGGNYAKIYKIFPYDECSACVLTPKMNQVGKHINISILTLTEVLEIKGKIGNFQVKLLQKPRYVDFDKCTGCQQCIITCPVEVPHEYNYGLTNRKAIYMDFAQQIPFIATIDKDHCINCKMCVQTCKANAIDHDMKEKLMEINVGSIVIATGFEEFDPSEKLPQFGYKRYKNVVTSLGYERMTHPAGLDNVVRPSDGKQIKKAIFVNCVGSRDETIDQIYCNKVCCMFGMKNARFLRMHEPNAEIYISYIDIRAAGKLFEEYYRSTCDQYNIKFIRGKAAEIQEHEDSSLLVRLENTETGEPLDIDNVDLVSLNCSFKPSRGTLEIAKLLNLKLAKDNFLSDLDNSSNDNFSSGSIETAIPGIYMIGTAHGPRDGTDTIAEAKAAASAAANHLKAPSKAIEIKEFKSIEDNNYTPRIGVFICHCGGIISSVVDIKKVVEEIKKIPNVEFVTNYLFMCSSPGQDLIKEHITQNNLNRIVVASCTPLVHEKTFRDACEEVGLSRFYFTGPINIREQCAMVHHDYPEDATEKAIQLIKGGIARVKNLKNVPIKELDVIKSTLIIGAGISGMNAALDVAAKGNKSYLIERTDKVGGRLNNLYELFPFSKKANVILNEYKEKIEKNSNIELFLNSEICEMSGYLGNYKFKLNVDGEIKEIEVGSVIVSIGTKEYEPSEGEYGYKKTLNIITTLELERKLQNNELRSINSVAFIQCVGSRAYKECSETGNVYCSRVCCNVSIMNAKILKEKFPNAQITIFYKQHLRAYGRYMEEIYREIQLNGVNFVRWTPEAPLKIQINENNKKPQINFKDSLINEDFVLEVDLLVLSVGQEAPEGIEKLCETLGITRSQDGFVEELHVKFKPVETKVPGIYSSASFPKDIADSVSLARASASAAQQLQKGIQLELTTAIVDEELCVGCGLCELICPYEANSMIQKNPFEILATTDEIKCKGCGTCVAACPVGARTLRWWTDECYDAQIDQILNED
ncbi:MAG: CoB--CoM heterodisulfide reductase iron-sulfur subunit A family protein [Candidatus Lokiarchaeota archaeon]|nr:CoB--CoM heterodisulfide reductase iron-sulfur subunit A family protein [Candidatus Lokiarchaeota archaeon]